MGRRAVPVCIVSVDRFCPPLAAEPMRPTEHDMADLSEASRAVMLSPLSNLFFIPLALPAYVSD